VSIGPIGAAHRADEELTDLVGRLVADHLAGRRAELERVHPEVAGVSDALAEFVASGGKRVRPAFAWWGWRGAGGDPGGDSAGPVLRAISALELLQANALLHDDVMDASATRRGRPTAHVTFAARHRERGWLGSPERFGESAAILLGDLALAWADDLLHDAVDELPDPPGPAARRAARGVWSAMRTEMLGGQYLDTWAQATGEADAEVALRVDRYKTAAYTVERPLHLGAALAGAPDELTGAYRRFGADLGVAFQLRDDLLGVFGDPAVTGKPAGDDLREGKRTLLVALALGAGDKAASEAVTRVLGNPAPAAGELERARSALVQVGAVAELERQIERLTERALDVLAAAPVAEPAASRLPELARAVTRRRA
jgi:geranylgeranyl diphosphate synthase, type I